MLFVKNLEKYYNDNLIFKNLTFDVQKGDKLAVLGLNGAGKSTLLKILSSNIDYNTGEIIFNKNIRISYMSQTIDEMDIDQNFSVFDFLKSGRPIDLISKKLNEIYLKLEENNTDIKLLEELGKYQSEFEYWGGYKASSELDTMINQMGIDKNILDKKLYDLSGGQKSKISFVRTLYSKPDILLLDEPTNHLDINSRDWIFNYLNSLESSVIFVSHDEEFIRKIANKILYLDSNSHTGKLYNFSYDRFIKTLEETNKSLEKQFKNQMNEIGRIQKFIDSQKGKSGKIKRQADSREKQLEKIKNNLVVLPKQEKEINIIFKNSEKSDLVPIILEKVSFSYDNYKNVIKNINLSVNRNEKLLIVGENGAGKSTLLKLIYGLLSPNSGSINISRKTKLGYYAQEYENIKLDISVLENLSGLSNLSNQNLRAFLNNFNFDKDKIKQNIKTLSPGERSRLELAKLSLSEFNVLLLDEPTNHLDLKTKYNIAKSFKELNKTFIIVSHDLDFIRELNIDRILILPSGKIQFFDENIVKYYFNLEN